MKKIAILLIMALLLAGCGEQQTDYTLNTAPTTIAATEQTMETTLPEGYREFATYPANEPWDRVEGNRYYYTKSPVLTYYDFEIEREVVLCSQPNCTHADEGCPAYLGENTLYLVSGDQAYAIVDSDGGIHRFLSVNLISGEKAILWDLSVPEGTVREIFQLSIDGNTAFLQFQQYDMHLTEDFTWEYSNRIRYAYAYDLTTGEKELLLEDPLPDHDRIALPGDGLDLTVTTEKYLFLSDVEDYELPMTEEEFLSANPDGDFLQYCSDFEYPEPTHYAVDRATGEKTEIYGSNYDAHIFDRFVYQGKRMCFMDGDTVCVYDGRTGEVTRYFTIQEEIGLLNFFDGRIIYNVYPDGAGTDTALWYWYDLTTGESQQFQEGENLMIFSLSGEATDYFIGLYNGRECYISKQDFYNENWSAAKSMTD